MSHKPQDRGDVLVVDDNPANLRLLTDMLGQEHFLVRVAADGAQALKSVAARLPDLILMDIRMPGMSGLDVCAQPKQSASFRQVPVLFLSALSDTEDKKRAFAVGGVDYITKPFKNDEVLVVLRNALAQRRLAGQRPGGMDPAAERSEQAHAPVAELVAEALDDDRERLGHRSTSSPSPWATARRVSTATLA